MTGRGVVAAGSRPVAIAVRAGGVHAVRRALGSAAHRVGVPLGGRTPGGRLRCRRIREDRDVAGVRVAGPVVGLRAGGPPCAARSPRSFGGPAVPGLPRGVAEVGVALPRGAIVLAHEVAAVVAGYLPARRFAALPARRFSALGAPPACRLGVRGALPAVRCLGVRGALPAIRCLGVRGVLPSVRSAGVRGRLPSGCRRVCVAGVGPGGGSLDRVTLPGRRRTGRRGRVPRGRRHRPG